MKTSRWLILAMAFCASFFASAQENPTPGLPLYSVNAPQPKTEPARADAVQAPRPATPVPAVVPATKPSGNETPAAGLASIPKVAPPLDPAKAAALLQLVDSAKDSVERKVPPPPHDITVGPSGGAKFVIGRNALNRILTPFADPVITASDNALVKRQGAAIFVTTDQDQPVALFVSPRDEATRSIALTLTPAAGLDPVDVHLHLEGYEPPPVAASTKDAAALEASQPYVDVLKDVFRELALGRIPSGYGLTPVKDGRTAWMPTCYMPGISITPRQVLEGATMVTVVARAVNTSIDTLEIDEGGCANRGVLAVAAWPNVKLSPGQETELYLAIRRPDPSDENGRRPTTLTRGGY